MNKPNRSSSFAPLLKLTMATHPDKRNNAEVNAKSHYSDSEDDEELEDQNWDDWEDEGDALEEHDSDPQMLCLFCDSPFGSCRVLFEHCASAHFFDFYGIKKAYNLDFYKCLKVINYVRSQVYSCTFRIVSSSDLWELFGH